MIRKKSLRVLPKYTAQLITPISGKRGAQTDRNTFTGWEYSEAFQMSRIVSPSKTVTANNEKNITPLVQIAYAAKNGNIPSGVMLVFRFRDDQPPNGWRLSCERLLAGRKEPCSVQRRSTAQRTNERFPPAALGSFKRWLGGAASHAAVDQPDRPRNARRGPPDLRKPARALGLRQSARGVGPRARAAGTRRAGCGRRRCGGRSCRARRRDSRRRCVPRRWHR